MSTLWTFGDSFLARDSNYISLYKEINKCGESNIQALPGSSLQYLLECLLKSKDLIKQNDFVLIGIPGPLRGYYKETHYCNLELFKTFDFQITENDLERDHRAIASHIINDIVPSLKTKNVKIFTTVENEFYGKYEYLPMMYCIMDDIIEHIAEVENLNPESRRENGNYTNNMDRKKIENMIQKFPNHIPFKYEKELSKKIVNHIINSNLIVSINSNTSLKIGSVI